MEETFTVAFEIAHFSLHWMRLLGVGLNHHPSGSQLGVLNNCTTETTS